MMLRHSSTTQLYAIALLSLTTSLHVTGQTLSFLLNHNQGYRVGDRAVVVCAVDSTAGLDIFTWTHNSTTIVEDDRISVAISSTASTLTINNLRLDDAGQYSCSKPGFPAITTTLTVIAENNFDFLNVEERQVFAEGTDAVVKCPAHFGNPAVASMFWIVDSTNQLILTATDKYINENDQLTIRNIRIEDSGTFQCSLRRLDPHEVITKTIQVEVRPQSEYLPKITDLRRRVIVPYGQPLELPCQLEEPRDNVNYSWTIQTEFEHDHLVNTESILHRNRRQFLGGIYTCRAENQFGYDIADFAVNIDVAPMPSRCATVSKTTPGSTVVLKYCDLTTPVQLSELKFQWSNGSVGIKFGGRLSVNHYGWLTIENVQDFDFGVYEVNISKGEDSAVHTVKLEKVELTTPSTSTPASLQAKLKEESAAVNLKFRIHGESTSCSDVKERNQAFIQEQLLKQFSFTDADIQFENPIISCLSTSKFMGTFKASLKGSNARQLVAQIRAKGISPFMLNNGQTITVKICANECSLEDSTAAKPWINKTSGVVIAVTVIAVMLAGVILLMVILLRYRRRSQSIKDIESDDEQVLPLHMAPYTSLDKNFMSKKPRTPYYRSISVNLPITSR